MKMSDFAEKCTRLRAIGLLTPYRHPLKLIDDGYDEETKRIAKELSAATGESYSYALSMVTAVNFAFEKRYPVDVDELRDSFKKALSEETSISSPLDNFCLDVRRG